MESRILTGPASMSFIWAKRKGKCFKEEQLKRPVFALEFRQICLKRELVQFQNLPYSV